ncbi:dephospho-CoA kinase [Nitrosophilus kaiyonis]|uniref:dephospho-CoA kinase n=1 Tax=Nitrosophilus kaiyonis TaxID=2930200 RepID=UPI00249109A9|nr:dephospho-CoA kinase [Nitrosophilus kaiyonis]
MISSSEKSSTNSTNIKPFEHAIALTGGIATGKSTVCNILKLYGFSIIDADKIAHEVLEEQKDKIEEIFGKKYIKNGKVDRKALGKLIFSDKEAKKELEKLLHPLIRKKIEEESIKLEKHKVPYIVDIPLFFETKNYPIKKVVLVYAPKDIQLQRLINREGLSKEEAIKRIDSQMDIEEKKEKTTYLIDNSKDLKHLQKEVDKFVEKVKNEFSQI